MKKSIFILLFLMLSCSDDKIYRKQLKNNEIAIDWYYYSYISSGSPNYVVIKKDNNEQLIFKDGFGIQDIELHNKVITILHLEFQTKPEIKKNNAFGYVVKYKEVSSHEMYTKYLKENK